ncbi:MAG TPA: 1-acyl-sn-glycerol-3-phosphate acyltransferase [Longimicrobiales bacterium]|nr:1-acyl-sn-glycerol-3-phosphate acyltransferase [Longimicrobiales bacterium]
MVAGLIRGAVAAAVAVFYRLERRGPAVPPGGVLIAANHPNSLMDPLVLYRTAGRNARPLAKAPLFRKRVVGPIIRALGGIPVYRRQDDPGQMERNEDTFRAAIEALLNGEAIQIFPEGRSHSDPALSPLRTGAARIGLAAEAAGAWCAGIRIVPVGLTFERKPFFRGRAMALYGEPIAVAEYRAAHERDPHDAARRLTAELERRLHALTLNLTEARDGELIDAAERLWAREKGLHGFRETAPLADRLPRLQAFARGLAWLRARDPNRFADLARRVRGYQRKARVLGAGEGEVPDRYRLRPTLRWGATRVLPAVLLAPVAAIGVVAWWIPYRLVGAVVARMRMPTDVIATYKLGAALVAMPLFLVLWGGLVARVWGAFPAAVAVVALPLIGVLTIRWWDGARAAAEDIRLFGRVAARPHRLERLAAERRDLVAAIDDVRRLAEAEAPQAVERPGGVTGPSA